MSTKKKKNAAATREAILLAARAAFRQSGYDGVGVREIAAAAGANVALVNRYFGSKERLFEEAVTSTFSIAELLPGGLPMERAGFPEAFAQHFLARTTRDSKELDSTLAMLRSAGNVQAEELMRIGLEERYIQPLAEWLGGDEPQARAALIAAVLAGVAVLRDVLGITSLRADEVMTEKLLARLLEVLVEADS